MVFIQHTQLCPPGKTRADKKTKAQHYAAPQTADKVRY
jgi:hypothetical protein